PETRDALVIARGEHGAGRGAALADPAAQCHPLCLDQHVLAAPGTFQTPDQDAAVVVIAELDHSPLTGPQAAVVSQAEDGAIARRGDGREQAHDLFGREVGRDARRLTSHAPPWPWTRGPWRSPVSGTPESRATRSTGTGGFRSGTHLLVLLSSSTWSPGC